MDETTSAANEGAAAFDRLELSARQAGAAMTAAFASAGAEGRKLEDVLRNVGARLGEMALQSGGQLASNLLTGGLSAALTGVASGGFGGFAETASGASAFSPASGAASRALSVTMNIATPDAESFQRSEAQVSAALARAVARGSRAM
jgi:hypothetical protein